MRDGPHGLWVPACSAGPVSLAEPRARVADFVRDNDNAGGAFCVAAFHRDEDGVPYYRRGFSYALSCAAGVLCYELINGIPPFETASHSSLPVEGRAFCFLPLPFLLRNRFFLQLIS